ncbi:MAG: hypothetical protein CVU08_02200 [Bacteroidetes bacterium HGW-Bacteroidetes-3]|nr:MAG: hypothetical protein CVU08_02200 [Bacteroidetes bacterium HGW-Bacteroidetes-3]
MKIPALRACLAIFSTDCHTEINSAQAGFFLKPRKDGLKRKARPERKRPKKLFKCLIVYLFILFENLKTQAT